MAYMIFGNTWWGQAWLKALRNIDYSNRLPRGRRYAGNGSVSAIEIKNNKIKAKVQGTRRKPYSIEITLPEFKKKEAEKLKNLINANPFYLAQLAAKKVPVSLLEDLENEKIKVFPSTWQDVDANCSCPDWAVPCKHIAAVIYITGNEIDKNPFLVFNLKNFDLLSEFELSEENSIAIPNSEQIVHKANKIQKKETKKITAVKSNKDYQEIIANIDFSKISDITKDNMTLLADKPLFYAEGNFKNIIAKAYNQSQKQIINFLEDIPVEDIDAAVKQGQICIEFKKDLLSFHGKIKTSFKDMPDYKTQNKIAHHKFSRHFAINKENSFSDIQIHSLIYLLNNLNLNNIEELHKTQVILLLFYDFAAKLIQQGAYIPELIQIDKKKFIIRWIPSLYNKKVLEVFNRLKSLLDESLLKVEGIEQDYHNQALLLSSLFLNFFVKTFCSESVHFDDINHLFFKLEPFTIRKFEDNEIPQTIQRWLSNFSIIHRQFLPIIKIDEANNANFSLELLVEDSTRPMTKGINLKTFINAPKNKESTIRILADLAMLADYFPAINNYLNSTTKKLLVSSTDFVDIWFKSLPVLNLLGIKTLVPKALREIFNPRISLRCRSKNAPEAETISYLSLGQLLDFEWTIAIGNDEYINPEDFAKLVRKYAGIVKIKDQYIYFDEKEIQKIIKQTQKEAKFSALDILKINLEGQYNGVNINRDEKVTQLFENLFKKKDVLIPDTLQATLRPYQLNGFQWLYSNAQNGFGSLLADDMGLGKTVQVISFLAKLKEENKFKKEKALIIVPATLMTNWEREIKKFSADLASLIYHGTERKLELKNKDIIITTYGLIRSDNQIFAKTKWFCIIIDEAQNIKNSTSNQTKAVKSLKAKIKIAMTGTPVENKLSEYWSIMDFVFPNYLGNLKFFKDTFAIPIEKFRNHEKLDLFKKITAPFILRRVKTDKKIIKDLPDKIANDIYCKLTKEQTAIYEKIVKDSQKILDQSEGIERKGLVFKLMTSLKQVCNHPVHYLKKGKVQTELSGKAVLLMQLLNKIRENHEKTLIFTQYKEMGDLLVDLINDPINSDTLFLHGGLTRKKRDQIVDLFQNDKAHKTLILSLKAGGTGLNLTAANHVIHYDLWWNPAVENQATDRAFRIGQKRNVLVYRFISKGTFEEKINEMLINKKELSDLTVNTGETWISELSNSDLKELVALDRVDTK